jgi:hypothetical protein
MTTIPPFPNLARIERDLLALADAIHTAFDTRAEISRLRALHHTEVADLMSSNTVAAFAAWLDPKEVSNA